MGGAVDAPAGTAIHFPVRGTHGSGVRIEAIEDGGAVPLTAESFDRTSDGRRHWIRINLRDQGGRLLLAGNPIYY